MKSLIIVHSTHHGNTEKIARAIAEALGAEVKTPLDVTPADIAAYDLIGFGAGIDGGKHYEPLLAFAESLPDSPCKKAFIFSTSAVKSPNGHTALREILTAKGVTVIGEFDCRGFTTRSVFALVGGKNKGRPNAEDLASARNFAEKLIKEDSYS
jgi:flavodoxin